MNETTTNKGVTCFTMITSALTGLAFIAVVVIGLAVLALPATLVLGFITAFKRD